ncbi:MAG: GntR family transcriptional regulator, partial [Chloroflexota bacterium]
MNAMSLANYPDLGEKTYHVLKEAILRGEYAPGSRLVIVEIAERLEVSRTPVADALNRLMAEKFVIGSPRKGYSVAEFNDRDIAEMVEASLVLQQGAAEMALARATVEDVAEMQRLLARMEELVDEDGQYSDVLAFMSLDRELHIHLVGLAQNRRLVELYDQLNSHFHIVRIRHAAHLVGWR